MTRRIRLIIAGGAVLAVAVAGISWFAFASDNGMGAGALSAESLDGAKVPVSVVLSADARRLNFTIDWHDELDALRGDDRFTARVMAGSEEIVLKQWEDTRSDVDTFTLDFTQAEATLLLAAVESGDAVVAVTQQSDTDLDNDALYEANFATVVTIQAPTESALPADVGAPPLIQLASMQVSRSGAALPVATSGNKDCSTVSIAPKADLSGCDLRGAHLTRAHLSGADLSRANLSGAYTPGADLSGADLSVANLSDLYSMDANLSDANLSVSNLSDAKLSYADLSGANLSLAYLSDADLSDADLSDANLSDAYLRRVNLSGADLSRADLSRTNLPDASLSRANLSRANLSDAYLSGADLSRANLSGAYLSGAQLSGANLSDADLSGADLSYANLSHANLSGANLSGANLSGKYMPGADLSGATCSSGQKATGTPARC
jgi:uncharacterized protein YjbI with pentapeptide repeats